MVILMMISAKMKISLICCKRCWHLKFRKTKNITEKSCRLNLLSEVFSSSRCYFGEYIENDLSASVHFLLRTFLLGRDRLVELLGSLEIDL